MKLIRITTVPGSLKTLLKGQLRFMKQQGFEVVAVSSDGPCYEDMLQEQDVRGIKINMTRKITPLKDLKALFLLVVLFVREKPDIVHTHTPKAGLLGMLAAFITRVPVRMHTVAGLPLLVANGKKRKILEWVEKLTYACATNIYPNSFAMCQLIKEHKWASKAKLKVIGRGSSNGIDTAFFSTNALFEKIAKQKEVFTFCFVGRMVKDKGVNELVRAFVKLQQTQSSIRLLLVGEFEEDLNPLEQNTMKLLKNHKAIWYVGHQKDVRPYFAIADALVFPSHREGFPNVVMQAGAMDLPSIVTDINGCNEIIVDGKNGEIIPSKDEEALFLKMKEWVEHPEKVAAMAANARQMIASRYEQRQIWDALLKEYHRLCPPRNKRA